jgi:large subunit ribosomal protein L15
VGRQDFTAKGVTVQAHAFTKSARDAIEGAGGKCELLSKTTNAVLVA